VPLHPPIAGCSVAVVGGAGGQAGETADHLGQQRWPVERSNACLGRTSASPVNCENRFLPSKPGSSSDDKGTFISPVPTLPHGPSSALLDPEPDGPGCRVYDDGASKFRRSKQNWGEKRLQRPVSARRLPKSIGGSSNKRRDRRTTSSRRTTRQKQSGGAERDRTADLLNAIQALSQLSYSPASAGRCGPAAEGAGNRPARARHQEAISKKRGQPHSAQPNPRPQRLRASHNCGTKCHVPALEEGVETAETPGDGFRAGWLVAA